MKILIYGTGGVGGYFGGKLAAAGNKVSFIARGKHLEAIREKGLIVKSYLGNFSNFPVEASDNLSDFETPELVLLCVKSWQLEAEAQNLYGFISSKTILLPLQNGADNYDKLARVLPENQILAGLCKIVSFVESSGVISHPSFIPQIVFGEINNRQTERVLQIQELFLQAGIECIIPENIQLEIWRKFLFICTISGIGALTRMPVGVNRSNVGIRDIMMQTACEIMNVAHKKNIPLGDSDLKSIFQAIDAQTPETTASMQRDIMNGKPSELDNFNGYIISEGNRLGVQTPVNTFIYCCLKPMETLVRRGMKK
ncbi:MAG: 2-dehydropantoate 2-reductase [Flavobacteriaceae bacterium]|nr:2-dehydropantoate 2-reductase [Flavobacteriaceae bacterium]MDZ4148995.1 2-dehydropantoate 2-reductase [Flavobacteriaceae bacterium]